MISLRELLSFKRVSFLAIIMPFFIDFLFTFENNSGIPYNQISILFIIILIFDYIYLYIFSKIKNRILLITFIHTSILFFFYFSYIVLFFSSINGFILNVNFKIRYIIPTVFGIVIFLIYINRSRLKMFNYVLNIFFIAITFIKIFNTLYLESINTKNIKIENIKGHPISIIQTREKPVILIIIDEYASPIELIKNYKDSNILNYQKFLLKDNWIVKNYMFSSDTSTINSLASLFNFNLQTSDQNLSIPFSREKLKKSSLYDSLEKKEIKFFNYGIFDIGKSKAMSKVYFIENEIKNKSFINYFFSNTLITLLFNNTFESMHVKHNQSVIEFKFESLKEDKNKSFYYFHLLMPHGPFVYHGKNHSYKNLAYKDRLKNYFEYWKFCNKILAPILSKLTNENKYKIILTGDHGFRGDFRINSHYTFSSFYGFEQEAIDNIKNVQDIGSLINSSY
jgi:hypothetical protein